MLKQQQDSSYKIRKKQPSQVTIIPIIELVRIQIVEELKFAN